jgi:hypothetical protein
MDVLFTLILAVLLFMAYRQDKFERKLLGVIGEIRNFSAQAVSSSSLNPLFSEEDMAAVRKLHEKWRSISGDLFDKLMKAESEEIKNFHHSGQVKSKFEPSDKLKEILMRDEYSVMAMSICFREIRRMIETNISILNGKSIDEAQKQFWESDSERDLISWRNPEIIEFTGIDGRLSQAAKEEIDRRLSKKKDYWFKHWDGFVEREVD